MKDVPMHLPTGLSLPVICEREDPCDAFVSNRFEGFEQLPKITAQLTAHYGQDHIHFIDGFPIPVCRYSRAKRHKISKNMQVLVIVLHNKRLLWF